MARFVVSDEAREDMAEIWSYIAANSESGADRVVAMFYDRFDALARNPMMGRSRPELLPNLRSFPAGSYVIFYLPVEEGVEILHVIHGARDITSLF